MIAAGTKFSDLPGPVKDLNVLDIAIISGVIQLMTGTAKTLGVSKSDLSLYDEETDRLVEASKP
ncbi:MAG: hypothetical protein HOP15_01285 [Planctomycetes bacterium]|nr:hypothetical protein [Planctomycetota bacterium]